MGELRKKVKEYFGRGGVLWRMGVNPEILCGRPLSHEKHNGHGGVEEFSNNQNKKIALSFCVAVVAGRGSTQARGATRGEVTQLRGEGGWRGNGGNESKAVDQPNWSSKKTSREGERERKEEIEQEKGICGSLRL